MRDALAALRRFGGSTARVLGDRLRGPIVEGVPRDAAGIDAGWLEAALRTHAPGVEVTGVERLSGHSGTTTRARIGVSYREDVPLPATLFLKVTPRGAPQRIFGHALGLFETEARFYREIGASLSVRLPRVYAVRITRDQTRFALVLEDLATAGARFVEVGERTTLEEAHAVMRALAGLHAAFWESPRFAGDLSWVRCHENRAAELRYEAFLTRQMLRAAVRKFGAGASPTLAAAARLVCDRRDALEAFWARGPRTLVHGDCHVGNLFFDGDEVGFLDWQVVARAPGMRDVGYFLSHSVPSELRERHQEALLESYLAGLRANGVEPPGAEEAFTQYRGFVLYGWLAAAFTAGAGGLQEPRIAKAGLDRTTRAVESLGSLALLDR